MKFDLHIHSNISDGNMSKLELLKLANDTQVKVIAFCDHNIYDNGVDILKEYESVYGKSSTLVIPGIELDASNPQIGGLHILGYGINDISFIQNKLNELEKENYNITKKQIQLLKECCNIDIDEEKICKYNNVKVVTYNALKNFLKQSSMDNVYKYLSIGQKAHMHRKQLSDREAIKIILKSGGVPILAHPKTLRYKSDMKSLGTSQNFSDYLDELKQYGLVGIESHTLKHTPNEQAKYLEIATTKGLICTAGSDFHNFERTKKFGVDYCETDFLFPLIKEIEKIRIYNKSLEDRYR